MHYAGQGVAKDVAEAARLFRLAADQGHAEAQYNLGGMHFHGVGVAKDLLEAARLFRLAADQRNAHAEYYLGRMYFTGEGGVQDLAEAARLLRLAADQGHAGAQLYQGGMHDAGSGGMHRKGRRVPKEAARSEAPASSAVYSLVAGQPLWIALPTMTLCGVLLVGWGYARRAATDCQGRPGHGRAAHALHDQVTKVQHAQAKQAAKQVAANKAAELRAAAKKGVRMSAAAANELATQATATMNVAKQAAAKKEADMKEAARNKADAEREARARAPLAPPMGAVCTARVASLACSAGSDGDAHADVP
jgi:hypothetical protein